MGWLRPKRATFAGDPIFIGGDGRSGTTLLSVILDSHPDLAVGPELHFGSPENLGPYALACCEMLIADDPRAFGKGLKEHRQFKPGVQFLKRCHRYGVEFDVVRDLIREQMNATKSDLSKFDDRCALVNAVGEHRRAATGKRRWGIKIMRDIGKAEAYAKLWPKSSLIHIIRDGRDVAASQLVDHGTWGYGDVERAAKGWVDLIDKVRAASKKVPILEIRYEDLVLDAEPTIRKIVEFLGVDWHDSPLHHSEQPHTLFDNPYNHPSIGTVVQPINASSIGRYRRDLSAEQRAGFERIARSHLDDLGYGDEAHAPVIEVTSPDAASGPVAVRFDDAACAGHERCDLYRNHFDETLVGRYVGRGEPADDPIVAARIGLEGLTLAAYETTIRRKYRGAALRQGRKAERAGYRCRMFDPREHVAEIVAINTSREERCGREMTEPYRRSVEELARDAETDVAFHPRVCDRHYDLWWGVFDAGDTLVGYIRLRREGDFALYAQLLGHGDHLDRGVMQHLHLHVMRWLLDAPPAEAQGLRHLIYAGYASGGEGLQRWKKKMCFEPARLVTAATPVTEGAETGSDADGVAHLHRR